jgi:uncharacterized membrane protein YgaE (UPF0421/DUF939 family)
MPETTQKLNTPRFFRFVIGSSSAPAFVDVLRTAVAAVASLYLAALFRLPNGYWAAISCLIVMLSTAGSELAVSVQRWAGTALGAAIGAAAMYLCGSSAWSFGLSVLAIGAVCWAAHIDRAAFRYGSIASAIVILVPHQEPAARVALHRFIEVSLGVGVGLAAVTVWPPRPLRPPA